MTSKIEIFICLLLIQKIFFQIWNERSINIVTEYQYHEQSINIMTVQCSDVLVTPNLKIAKFKKEILQISLDYYNPQLAIFITSATLYRFYISRYREQVCYCYRKPVCYCTKREWSPCIILNLAFSFETVEFVLGIRWRYTCAEGKFWKIWRELWKVPCF
jgi:hypothetical protein